MFEGVGFGEGDFLVDAGDGDFLALGGDLGFDVVDTASVLILNSSDVLGSEFQIRTRSSDVSPS